MEDLKLYSAESAAKIFEVEKSTIYKWAARGLIGFVKTPEKKGTIRFSRAHLEKFIADRSVEAKNNCLNINNLGQPKQK